VVPAVVPPVGIAAPLTPSRAGDLRLDKPSSPPGGPVTAIGTGCPPGVEVEIEVAESWVATTTAGADGSFTATFAVPDLDVGRVPVVARCRSTTLQAPLDIALGSAVAQSTSVMVVLLFFLLVSIGLARRRRDSAGG